MFKKNEKLDLAQRGMIWGTGQRPTTSQQARATRGASMGLQEASSPGELVALKHSRAGDHR
jgi:hypothetical protein